MKNFLSDRSFWLKAAYQVGIALGIIIVVAFISSQLIYPLILGRAKLVPVPEVIGQRISIARDVLNESRLHAVIRDSIYNEDVPIDTIIDQNPAAGEMVKYDGTVFLTISKGTKYVSVPYVTGVHYETALVMIRNAGFRAVVSDSLYSEEHKANTVIRTEPGGGAKVESKKIIRLILSKGERPIEEEIPEPTDDAIGE